ncbi:hypothetical protein LTR37_013867, partial [Vermiconidia calcicola]
QQQQQQQQQQQVPAPPPPPPQQQQMPPPPLPSIGRLVRPSRAANTAPPLLRRGDVWSVEPTPEPQTPPSRRTRPPPSSPASTKKLGTHQEKTVFRQPQSVSDARWTSISDNRKRVLSHVGRIDETSNGTASTCDECGEQACRTYKDAARQTYHDGSKGYSCSRCRDAGISCSLQRDTTTIPPRAQNKQERIDELEQQLAAVRLERDKLAEENAELRNRVASLE